MTPEQLTKLKDGDIIRNLSSGDAYNVLRNTGSTVIAVRTLEVTNAIEWEHVYTTPSPTVFEMIDALESCGWTYDATLCHGWIAPDGFVETSLHRAYELRDEHPRMAIRPLVEKGSPRPYPGPVTGPKELQDAGWYRVSCNVWKSPSGALHGTCVAWRIMDNAKIAACTAAGVRPDALCIWDKINELDAAGWKRVGCSGWEQPGTTCVYNGADTAWHRMDKLRSEKLVTLPTVSFQEARAALVAAGWKNIYSRVWRSPSEALFDGTRAAYDAMKKL